MQFCPIVNELTSRFAAKAMKREAVKKILYLQFVFFFSAAIALAVLQGCKSRQNNNAPLPTVEVTEVIQRDIPVYQEYIGTLDGFVDARIRPQVSGYLMTQDYNEGSFVKAGDLLFQIDSRPFEAALAIAKGKLAEAQAQLGKTDLDVKRFMPLAKQRAISQEELDDAIQANLAAKADVNSANAAVEEARLNLGFTKITSPIDGIAAIATAQIGDLVGPSTNILTTVSTVDPIKAVFTIPEQVYMTDFRKFFSDTSNSNKADPPQLELFLSDETAYPAKGKIYTVDRDVNLRTGAVRLEGLFPNPGNVLRPGQFTRVRIKLEEKKGALLVPQRAVTELQDSYQVAVVNPENKIEIRPVKVGIRIGNLWVIEVGLKAGERVVAEGTQKVRAQMTVTVKPFTPIALKTPTSSVNSEDPPASGRR